ncbi:hypothetical protein ACF0H5_014254 [Mactra antiquata]
MVNLQIICSMEMLRSINNLNITTWVLVKREREKIYYHRLYYQFDCIAVSFHEKQTFTFTTTDMPRRQKIHSPRKMEEAISKIENGQSAYKVS